MHSGANGDGEAVILDRLERMERWRDAVDSERGIILRELGELGGTLKTTLASMDARLASIGIRLESFQEKLDDRPSKAEFQVTERQIESIRAKQKKPSLAEVELSGPAGLKFKLLGVSGVTIVLALFLLVLFGALWLLSKH